MYARWNAVRRATGYRSQFEADVAATLPKDARYEEAILPYTVTVNAHYKPDWLLPQQAIVLEAKGRFTKDDRDKMLLIKQQYPKLDVRLVFQNLKQKVTGKMTVLGWCAAHGFLCCQGPALPEAWLRHKPRVAQRKAFDAICNTNNKTH